MGRANHEFSILQKALDSMLLLLLLFSETAEHSQRTQTRRPRNNL